jgi:hypothetical protein
VFADWLQSSSVLSQLSSLVADRRIPPTTGIPTRIARLFHAPEVLPSRLWMSGPPNMMPSVPPIIRPTPIATPASPSPSSSPSTTSSPSDSAKTSAPTKMPPTDRPSTVAILLP